ncbi:PAQR family membrane homeostasis protein TrhA [Ekhidna sp. To15]|uniref:PAQR family membrane homeostasis protein TrhA n=1 Tax=Ekhidna sp. To15 TaxID=3395267 RepID=UPI003F526F94
MSNAHYSAPEERLNVLTHGFGIIISVIGLILLQLKSSTFVESASTLAFGLSLILLYCASTFYHAAKSADLRAKLRILDHASIYILIAGTYTPVCLITLADNVGQTLFYTIWGVGLSGVILKIFFTGKFDKLSTAMYVLMGWIAIFAIKPLLSSMPVEGLLWLLAGGVFYTVGAVLYSIRSIPMNHAIFHIFVLLGSFSHYMMIYNWILYHPPEWVCQG